MGVADVAPTRWQAVALLAVLLASPAAADVDLTLSHEFRLSQATFLAGNLTLAPGASLVDPVVTGPRSAAALGTLTVCPEIFEADGVVRSAVLAGLALVDPQCDGGQSFTDPVLVFGRGTRLAFAGGLEITRMPGAVLLAPFGNGTVAMALGGARLPLALAPAEGVSAFGATAPATSVAILQDGGPTYFNGTSYAYFLNGDMMTLDAAAIASALEGPFQATLVPAGREDLEQALSDPFALLDAEEVLYGADAREPRGNVSTVLREFGRVPAYVDGALFGHLNGTAGGSRQQGDVSLVRGDRFVLTRNGDHLAGSEEPTVTLSPAGVAFDGGEPREAPWVWAALLWLIALLVLVVRRRAPQRKQRLRALWLAAALVSLVVVDLLLLRDDLGAGLASEARGGASPGTLLALATFELVLVGASFVALVLPARLLVGRLVPQRWLVLGEAGLAILWILLPVLLPATTFAMGYDLARL